MSTRSAKRVRELSIEEELGESFGRYAEKVILDRAIPDIRDGLKPVQRRIIFAMYDSGNTHDKPYRKSASTVGEVMGKYHPHGDSAIYDALVRLAQPWKMRYPLVDGHGNFGSMDDDPAAAMRYTEARLSPIALELLRDIEKETVPTKPNFDEKLEEPTVLPAGFLNLLVNGTSGVSAGFATNIPSHNLREVTSACVALVDDPSLSTEDLMGFVRGPDFPTGGIMMGAEGLREAYETGRGKVVLRARHAIEKLRDGKHLIVFTEIPYNVVKSDLVRQMDGLRLDKEVHGVLDVRDESDRTGLRVVVEVGKAVDPEDILAYLFKKTDLQINFHFNMVAIWRNTPRQVGLRQILMAFVDHRREVVRARSRFDLDKARTRLHEVEGLIKAIDILDDVIAAIRASNDRAEARGKLQDMGFTEAQAEAILELRLARLTNLSLLQLTDEAKELRGIIDELTGILSDPAVCDEVVQKELWHIAEKFGDARRTDIEEEVERLEVALEVMVKPQDVVVGVTRQGWIKRVSMASYQASGGDRKSSGVAPGDRMHHVILTNTTHTLLVLSASGQCFPIPVHEIPEARWGDVGTSMVNVCGIEKDDPVVAVIARDEFPEDEYLLMVSRGGQVKATPLAEFESSRSAGLVAMKLDDDDRLAAVLEHDLSGELLLCTYDGQGIRFEAEQVSVQGRSAKGVRGIKVDGDDYVNSVLPLHEEGAASHIAVFTVSGRGKRTPLEQYPRQNRGGKGVRMLLAGRRTNYRCVAIVDCDPEDEFEIVDSAGGEQVIKASRLNETRRDGNVWQVMNLKDGAQVVLVERIRFEEPEGEDGADADEGGAG